MLCKPDLLTFKFRSNHEEVKYCTDKSLKLAHVISSKIAGHQDLEK